MHNLNQHFPPQTQLIQTNPTIPASTNQAFTQNNLRKWTKALRQSICLKCHMIDLYRI